MLSKTLRSRPDIVLPSLTRGMPRSDGGFLFITSNIKILTTFNNLKTVFQLSNHYIFSLNLKISFFMQQKMVNPKRSLHAFTNGDNYLFVGNIGNVSGGKNPRNIGFTSAVDK